jgi:hypothetical protein
MALALLVGLTIAEYTPYREPQRPHTAHGMVVASARAIGEIYYDCRGLYARGRNRGVPRIS